MKKQGEVTWCADIGAPPLSFYDKKKNEVGIEIELGDEIAERLELESVWRYTSFDSIIPTLVASQCDAIMSQLYIKPERETVVDFVPYMTSGQSVVTDIDNPESITGLDESLCGKRVSTTTATTAYALIADMSKNCEASGEEKVTIARFQNDINALQQLALGRSDAYATTTETAAYYMTQQPDTYAFAGESYETITCGIAVKKGNTDLQEAIAGALKDMQEDGTYKTILKEWSLERAAI